MDYDGNEIGERSRTTAPYGPNNLGTDDIDATISERVDFSTDDETVTDDLVSVSVRARLTTGSAEYVGARHVASVCGALDDYAECVRAAQEMAERMARNARSAARASMAPLGADRFKGPEMVTREDYETLGRYVRRAINGNAGTGKDSPNVSSGEYVKAGVRASGIPVDVDLESDATQYAALILWKWRAHGLPDSIAAHVADMSDESAARMILGSAARDGIRLVSHQPRSVAREATARFESRLPSYVNSPTGSKRQANNRAVPARVDRTAYLGVAEDRGADVVSAILGNVSAYPTLAALVLSDGSVSDALRRLGESTSGPSRVTFKRAARVEWETLVMLEDSSPVRSERASALVR